MILIFLVVNHYLDVGYVGEDRIDLLLNIFWYYHREEYQYHLHYYLCLSNYELIVWTFTYLKNLLYIYKIDNQIIKF